MNKRGGLLIIVLSACLLLVGACNSTNYSHDNDIVLDRNGYTLGELEVLEPGHGTILQDGSLHFNRQSLEKSPINAKSNQFNNTILIGFVIPVTLMENAQDINSQLICDGIKGADTRTAAYSRWDRLVMPAGNSGKGRHEFIVAIATSKENTLTTTCHYELTFRQHNSRIAEQGSIKFIYEP